MQALERIATELRGIREDINGCLAHYEPDVGYFRPCQLDEKLEDVAKEAIEHKSIVAMRGNLFCIMAVLIDGWVKVNVGWKQ